MSKRAAWGQPSDETRMRMKAVLAKLVAAGLEDLLTLERSGTPEAERTAAIARLADLIHGERRLPRALWRALRTLPDRGTTEFEAAIHLVHPERNRPRERTRVVELRAGQRRQGTARGLRPSDFTPLDFAGWFRQEVRGQVRGALWGGRTIPARTARKIRALPPERTTRLDELVADEAAAATRRGLVGRLVGLNGRASLQQRQLLKLTVAHPDWPERRFAEEMGLKLGTVKAMRHRLRKKL